MATREAAIERKQASADTTTERIDEGGLCYTPRVDIFETPDTLVFQSDLPGVKADDVEINCDDGEISIRGKVRPRQPEAQQYLDREYGVGDFYRSFTVEAPVRPEAIKAELKDGVLTLTVPKAESAKTRKIPIITQ